MEDIWMNKIIQNVKCYLNSLILLKFMENNHKHQGVSPKAKNLGVMGNKLVHFMKVKDFSHHKDQLTIEVKNSLTEGSIIPVWNNKDQLKT